jgi:hypothetical protein
MIRRGDLMTQADEILKRARCDAVTGAKKDRQFQKNKRAESRSLGRHWRARKKQLGKFGAASPVRHVEPAELENAESKPKG